MFRRFLVTWCKRTGLFFLIICVGCSAQLAPTELAQKIEKRLRVTYNVPATVKVVVSAPHPSEFANYDALTVTFDGDGRKQDYQFLLSKDQKTLIRMTRMDLTKDPYAEIMKKIDVKGRPVRGNPNAKVMVISYDDFECPFCSRAHQTLFPELLKEYGDRVAFIYKDFPLTDIHPWAIHAAIDANCLAAQSQSAYWSFADFIHGNRIVVDSETGRDKQFAALDRISMTEGAKFQVDAGQLETCMKAQNAGAVTASIKEGESLGVDGTPTMFVNGRMVNGARSAEELRAILDRALEQAGVAAPVHPAAAPTPAPNPGGGLSPH
jgi:protein-disulfide isomerase